MRDSVTRLIGNLHQARRYRMGFAALCISLIMNLPTAVNAADETAQAAVREVIFSLQDTWNAGDMSAYLDHYQKDDSLRLTFGNSIVKGWRAMEDLFRKSYPDPERMGRFTVDRLEVQLIDDQTAIALGNFTHVFPKETIKGGFSHVLTRDGSGTWIIRHERTSRGEVIENH